jgi:hypothetical protein
VKKRPDHSIVYTGGGGRLGNQLIRFVHWIAWIRAQDADTAEVINLSFWPFSKYFAAWAENPACVFPQRRLATAHLLAKASDCLPSWVRSRTEWRWQSLVSKAGKTLPNCQSVVLNDEAGEAINLESPSFLEQIHRSRITVCRGWKLASWRLVAEQQDELRKLFVPATSYSKKAADFLAPIRERYDVVAGLLIRQSDYRQWQGGAFCFSQSDYRQWIRQLLEVHSGRRVAVIIASDERQDPSMFAGLPYYFTTGSVNSGGHWFESAVQLSLCDFILSPPSTFSAVAGFIGNIPLWPLTESRQTLAPEQLLRDALVGAAHHPVFAKAVK